MRTKEEIAAALEHNRSMENIYEERGDEVSLNQFKGRVDALAWVLGQEQPTLDRARGKGREP